jgi:hypothetical protein
MCSIVEIGVVPRCCDYSTSVVGSLTPNCRVTCLNFAHVCASCRHVVCRHEHTFDLDVDEAGGSVVHVFAMTCPLCGRGSSIKSIPSITVDEFLMVEAGKRQSSGGDGTHHRHESESEPALSAVEMAEGDGNIWSRGHVSSVYVVDEPLTLAEVMAAQEPEVIAAALPAGMQQSMWERLKAMQCGSDEDDVPEVPVSYD